MSDKQEPQMNRNFFDSLMFGPPQGPSLNQSQAQQGSHSSEPQNRETSERPIEKKAESATEGEVPQIDFIQLMQQVDVLMGYANKIGPSLKKMGPLFELLKNFSDPKK